MICVQACKSLFSCLKKWFFLSLESPRSLFVDGIKNRRLTSTNSFFLIDGGREHSRCMCRFALSQSIRDLGFLFCFPNRLVKNIDSPLILSIQGKFRSFLKRAQSCLPYSVIWNPTFLNVKNFWQFSFYPTSHTHVFHSPWYIKYVKYKENYNSFCCIVG